jgi:hypothetical protein
MGGPVPTPVRSVMREDAFLTEFIQPVSSELMRCLKTSEVRLCSSLHIYRIQCITDCVFKVFSSGERLQLLSQVLLFTNNRNRILHKVYV